MKKHVRLLKITGYACLGIVVTIACLNLTNAKYTFSSAVSNDSAGVSKFGTVEVREHLAVYDNGYYTLDGTKETKTGNIYEYVIPGVDIPKDPWVLVDGQFDVSFALYLKIVKDNFPKSITYSLIEEYWDQVEDNTYKYKGIVPMKDEIKIIEDDTVFVSQNYHGNGTFELTFFAWVEQI